MRSKAIECETSGHSYSGASDPKIAAAVLLLSVCLACTSTIEHDVKGRIVGFSDDSLTVIVAHDDVPGFMPAMTMPFKTRGKSDLRTFKYGDAISFRLFVGRDASWIGSLKHISNADLDSKSPINGSSVNSTIGPIGLLPGERVPPIELSNELGEKQMFFAGDSRQLILMDFIYTRCPIPEFCPLLSRRFKNLQQALGDEDLADVLLASITVDPDYDKPEVLRSYGQRYEANPDVWRFYTGNPETLDSLYVYLGISLFAGDEQPIAHPLVTAVLRGNGVLQAIWRDTDWSENDVLATLRRLSAEQSLVD